MSFDVLSLFLSDLVFSDRQMKKGHEGIMVESEYYHRIVCCFAFSDTFHMIIESLDEYQDRIESTRLKLG